MMLHVRFMSDVLSIFLADNCPMSYELHNKLKTPRKYGKSMGPAIYEQACLL